MFKKALLLCTLLISCNHDIDYYKKNKPEMNFKEFYNREIVGHGTYTNIFGRVTSRFVMTSKPINFDKEKNKVTYKQSITYLEDNKKKDFESYAIFNEKDNEHFYYKDEMMKEEAEYEQEGNVAHVEYDLKIERDNGKYIYVKADDWAFMIDKDNIINKIKISKFGFPVGYITMSIKKK